VNQWSRESAESAGALARETYASEQVVAGRQMIQRDAMTALSGFFPYRMLMRYHLLLLSLFLIFK
jgi:hypothetical protein